MSSANGWYEVIVRNLNNKGSPHKGRAFVVSALDVLVFRTAGFEDTPLISVLQNRAIHSGISIPVLD